MKPINEADAKCKECELIKPHFHCNGCSHALPYSIVALGTRVPTSGESLRIIPGNFVVMCPNCGDGVLIRVRKRFQ